LSEFHYCRHNSYSVAFGKVVALKTQMLQRL